MAFNYKSNCLANFLFALCISCTVIFVVNAGSTTIGITVDLFHRDSPLSPFYNPKETRFNRIQNAFRRSSARLSSFNPASVSTTDDLDDSAEAAMLSNISGDFLMKISIGSPPVEIQAIADTGSSLIWTNCVPEEPQSFDPNKSTTYVELKCPSKPCTEGNFDHDNVELNCDSGICKYSTSYYDHTTSAGNLATETFILRSSSGESKPFRSVVFGCDNRITSSNIGASGIIGLGGGELSMVNQLYKSNNSLNRKFSYCLLGKTDASSKISFGNNALVSGPNVVSTPLMRTSPHYYLHLEGVTVGSKRFNYTSGSTYQNKGNIMIDSGTMDTYLPQDIYEQVERELKQVVNGESSYVSYPDGNHLCYDFEPPKTRIVVHFTGADVELPLTSTFQDFGNGKFCSTLMPPYAGHDDSNGVIFGYLSQVNYLVGYDLVNDKLSFMSTHDCSIR